MTLNTRYFSEVLSQNKSLGPDIEDSYAHLFTQNRALIWPDHIWYKPCKVGKNRNDGYGAYYDRNKNLIFKTIIEFKLNSVDYWVILCQILAYYMPIRCSILTDEYIYTIDKFRYFEIVTNNNYVLLDLSKAECILDSFEKIFNKDLMVTACKAHYNSTYEYFAKQLVPFLEIHDIEEMCDTEIVTRMYTDYYKGITKITKEWS